VYFQNNLASVISKQTQLLGSFDGYEKYLYYQTSSYVTSSYGEFYPSTWPKYTTTKDCSARTLENY
jgi:GH24 family phage-related lysozyme (muramidase)